MVSKKSIQCLIDGNKRALDRAMELKKDAEIGLESVQWPMNKDDYVFKLTYANAQINAYKVVISELESLIKE